LKAVFYQMVAVIFALITSLLCAGALNPFHT